MEGRFSFINHIEQYNKNKDNKDSKDNKDIKDIKDDQDNKDSNKKKKKKKNNKKGNQNSCDLSEKESEYRKFLFYRHFLYDDKPLIITEGKTDITYIKSALKNLYDNYPNLITKKDDNSFEFAFSFFRRTENIELFLMLVLMVQML